MKECWGIKRTKLHEAAATLCSLHSNKDHGSLTYNKLTYSKRVQRVLTEVLSAEDVSPLHLGLGVAATEETAETELDILYIPFLKMCHLHC